MTGIRDREAPLANRLLPLLFAVSLRVTDAPRVSFIGYPGSVASPHPGTRGMSACQTISVV